MICFGFVFCGTCFLAERVYCWFLVVVSDVTLYVVRDPNLLTRSGKTTSGNGIGLEFAKFQRAVEDRGKWRKLVVKSSVVPQRPSWCRD